MTLLSRVAAALAIAASCGALAAGVVPPPDRPALASRHAAQSVLLDVTFAGSRAVAVGERGIAVLSDDGGIAWRQARVPVSVSLTKVTFVDARIGWAVGHYGVVLHTSDGGETWQRQLATTGTDKPLFDVLFTDERNGFVVGADNLVLRTRDGGRTWTNWSDRVDNPRALHLYVVGVAGAYLYLAGEQGLFLRSRDGGETFARLATPYKTSYFTSAATRSGVLLLAGLRGRAIRSLDSGDAWTALDVPDQASFIAAAQAGDGKLVLGSQGGQLFVVGGDGRTVRQIAAPPVPGLTGIAIDSRGTVLVSGAHGVTRIEVPELASRPP